MDDKTLENILGQIYELEGLVMVARRDNADRGILLRSMQEKVNNINSLLGNEQQAIQPAMSTSIDVQHDAEPPQCGNADNDPVVQNDEPEAAINKFANEAATICTNIDYKPGDSTPIGLMAAISDDDEAPAKEADEERPEYDDGHSSHDSTDEPATEMTFDYVEPAKTEQGDLPDGKVHDEQQPDDREQSPLTLGDMLSRNMSRDLKRAFTVSDWLRFRRELFGNSDVEMNDTLNLVETMQSYAEAEEYFYGAPMSWDKESPEVIDFMAILRNHFYAK